MGGYIYFGIICVLNFVLLFGLIDCVFCGLVAFGGFWLLLAFGGFC